MDLGAGSLAKTVAVRETRHMAIARDTIEKQVLKWPPAKRVALAEKLMASVEDFATAEIEAAWNTEIEARVNEVRGGRVDGISAEEAMAKARKRLHEARRLSPPGRRRAR